MGQYIYYENADSLHNGSSSAGCNRRFVSRDLRRWCYTEIDVSKSMTAEYIFQWYEKPVREPSKGMIGSYATFSYNKGECIDGKKFREISANLVVPLQATTYLDKP